MPWFNKAWTTKADLRVLRRVGPDRAKAVVLFKALDHNDRHRVERDVLLTIFLSYQDGCWTTERFETASRGGWEERHRATFAFLMLAIDEVAEK